MWQIHSLPFNRESRIKGKHQATSPGAPLRKRPKKVMLTPANKAVVLPSVNKHRGQIPSGSTEWFGRNIIWKMEMKLWVGWYETTPPEQCATSTGMWTSTCWEPHGASSANVSQTDFTLDWLVSPNLRGFESRPLDHSYSKYTSRSPDLADSRKIWR